MLFFATITQQRRPRCCGCLFVVHFVLVLFKEEEEEEAILVGVDDDVAKENMAMMMILLRVCVCLCVYLRVDIMEKLTHFPPQLVLKLRAKSACQRDEKREERHNKSDFVRRSKEQ